MEIDTGYEKQIKKEYGDVLIDASFILESPKKIISVSPALDIALRGGIVEGSWLTLSGNPKCGKTTLSLHIAAKAQQMGKLVLYVNSEGRLKSLNLKGIKGLDSSKLKVLTSISGHILTAEQYLNATSNFVKLHPGCVVIVDSVSDLCSNDEMVSDIEANRRPIGPRLLAQFFRQLGGIVPIQNAIVVLIHHLIEQQGRFTSGKSEDGGMKAKYKSDTMLRCKYTEQWKDAEKEIGHKIHWDLIWSALGPPVPSVTSYLRYGHGIDETVELFFIAADFGLITSKGAWYNLDFLINSEDKQAKEYVLEHKNKDDRIQFQGQANVVEFLNQNSYFLDLLYKEVTKLI